MRLTQHKEPNLSQPYFLGSHEIKETTWCSHYALCLAVGAVQSAALVYSQFFQLLILISAAIHRHRFVSPRMRVSLRRGSSEHTLDDSIHLETQLSRGNNRKDVWGDG